MKNLKENSKNESIEKINQSIDLKKENEKKENELKKERFNLISSLSNEIKEFKDDSKKLNIFLKSSLKKFNDLSIKEKGKIFDSISIYLMKKGIEKGMKIDFLGIDFDKYSIKIQKDESGLKKEDIDLKGEIEYYEKGELIKGELKYIRFQFNGIWMKIKKSDRIGWKKYENFSNMIES